jgi:hypothetical protein
MWSNCVVIVDSDQARCEAEMRRVVGVERRVARNIFGFLDLRACYYIVIIFSSHRSFLHTDIWDLLWLWTLWRHDLAMFKREHFANGWLSLPVARKTSQRTCVFQVEYQVGNTWLPAHDLSG